MEREYVMRGKRMTVEEVENVLAVKVAAGAQTTNGDVRAFGETARALPNASEEEVQGFARAGWRFVVPSDATRRAAAGAPMAGAEAVQRVFLRPSGRVLLGTDRLSVRLTGDLTEAEAEALLAAENLQVVNRLRFAPNMYEVRVASGADFLAESVRLSGDPRFLFAEPQFLEHIPARFVPSDPDYAPEQWHLNNTGQDGGTAGADISAEEAWNFTRGAGVRIAVVDNGMQVDHPDLAAGIAATSGFFQSSGMGGANFVQGLAGFPDGAHGTFCCGMAAARHNNSEGGCGVAPEADLIAIACLNDQVGTQVTLARAVAYAADPTQEVPSANPADGADVIVSSLGPNGADWDLTATLQTAIDFAVTNGRGGLGTPVFWACSNGNVDIGQDEVVSYVNTIAVGRSTRNDTEDGSAHGPALNFLATGVDVYNTDSGSGYRTWTGTSFAAPTAAGVGALLIALNGNLTWQQVRDAMRAGCDKIGGVVYDGNGHHDNYGFGRVNAANAACQAAFSVALQTPSITFNDVPEGEQTARAIVFHVVTCQAATFQIIAGPTVTSGPGSFGTLPSPNATLSPTSSLSSRPAMLWLSFTGTAPGDIATGEVTVRLVETGQQWVIPISANSIERPTVGVVLTLDQSGSMLAPSGLPAFPTRSDVLKFAAPVFVNVLQEHNGIGIAAFDQDAYPRMNVATAGPPSPFDPVRTAALGTLAAYAPNPAGLTAIGDGVEQARSLLTAGPSYDQQAIVVFTDGFDTASKGVADVSGLIDQRVFAIGLGTADQVKPAALTALTNGTGGYLLLTGAIGPDDLFRLSKYYLQVLAGVTNQDIVLDPEGALKPGFKHRIPFVLNEADIGVDAILVGETQLPLFHWALETPAGDLIDPTTAGSFPGSRYVQAQGVSFYRLTLPVPLGSGAHAGTWHAVLSVDAQYYKRYLSSLDNSPQWYQNVLAHGVRYSLNVQAHSGLRLQGRLLQDSLEPGATLTLRGVLTEYGLPVPGSRATVQAAFERPDGTTGLLALSEQDPGSGVYLGSQVALLPGVYRYRLLASGKTLRGRDFTREHLATGAVWQGGDRPDGGTGRPDGGDGNGRPGACDLLGCLTSDRVLTPEFIRRLRRLGINLDAVRDCLKGHCQDQPQPVPGTAGVIPRPALTPGADPLPGRPRAGRTAKT